MDALLVAMFTLGIFGIIGFSIWTIVAWFDEDPFSCKNCTCSQIEIPWRWPLFGLVILVIMFAVPLSNVDFSNKMPIEDKQILDSFIGIDSREAIITLGRYTRNDKINEEYSVIDYDEIPKTINMATREIKFTKSYKNISFIIKNSRVETWRYEEK